MEFLTGLFSGWKAWAAALGLSAVVAACGGFYAGHHWAGDDLAALKAQYASQQAADATAALKKLQSFIDNMQTASAEYGQVSVQLDQNFAALKKDLRNAIKAAPLPPGCFPDAGRVRALTEAVTATNAAADPEAVGGFGETVRTPPAAHSGGL